jgi:penicillin-binding protein 1A
VELQGHMTKRRRVTVVVLRSVAVVLSVIALSAFAASAGLMWLASTLPDLDTAPIGLGAPRTSVVYAADGSVIAEWHGGQDRKVVPLASIPKAVRDAVVAAEDPSFYTHTGLASGAVEKALGMSDAGSSVHASITQQLVKMIMAANEWTFVQKVREALMAYLLETRTSKDKVLEAYLTSRISETGATASRAPLAATSGSPRPS